MMFLTLLVAAEAAALVNSDAASPVTKVVNLLKDMRVQLDKEGEEDEDVYQKVSCWCETNNGDKTTAIADAESRIKTLQSTIEAKTAESARLSTEIKNLDDEVAKNTEALAKATEMRRKELKEFTAEEKDALQSIAALKQAVNVLGKHHESLIQVPEEGALKVVALVADQLANHQSFVNSIITPSQRKALKAFVQSPAEFFTQVGAPQSGAIFGILQQMKETFQTNLASSQKEEATSLKSYEELKAAKESEISAGQQQSDQKSQELADADSALAQASQDQEDTEATLAADVKFLANLKETCKTVDNEYEVRKQTRAEEVVAVSEALEILSGDDARDTFTRTYSFVQTSQRQSGADQKARQASKVLFAAAKATGSPMLSALATQAAEGTKLDGFKAVQEKIDLMVKDLKQQKKDEIALRDSCLKELNDNEIAQEDKAHDIRNLETSIADEKQNIAGLTDAINKLKAEVAEMATQLLHAGQDREVENKDFQLIVADQRATQELVSKALDSLNKFYAKKDAGAGLLQSKHGQTPPAQFKTYKKDKGGGVIGMLNGIVDEAAQLEKDAIQAESEAQKAYEAFVQDSNESMGLKNRAIVEKEGARGEADADKVAQEQDLASAKAEQEQNESTNADLHKSCDFTLNNFTARQAANDQEVKALGEAKAILNGSGMKLFLQRS